MRTNPMDATAAHRAVEAMADWSEWRPFAEAAQTAPRSPGVYLFRLPETGEIVYVGMAGPRTGSGAAQGLRGRLSIYSRGRGAVSGFGEAALDRALADEDWLEEQLASLRTDGPKRAKVWAQEAIAFLAPEVRWTECLDKCEALRLEMAVEDILGRYGLWNRSAEKLRAHRTASESEGASDAETDPGRARPVPVQQSGPARPGSESPTVFALHGYSIDLDVLYREMYGYSVVVDGGRLFNGMSKDTPAIKRLLNELFGVPVTDKIHPVNNAIRSECRDRLDALGWATKMPGRSGRYVLHREL